MALQIEWTPDALLQLNEILEYWIKRNDSHTYSNKLYGTIKNILTVLSKYPESGKLTENSKIRTKILKDYLIFYSYDNKILTVLGFCDMRRDPLFIKSILDS